MKPFQWLVDQVQSLYERRYGTPEQRAGYEAEREGRQLPLTSREAVYKACRAHPMTLAALQAICVTQRRLEGLTEASLRTAANRLSEDGLLERWHDERGRAAWVLPVGGEREEALPPSRRRPYRYAVSPAVQRPIRP